MSKYKYNINNLDCANCARTIEDTLNKNTSLQNVVVNFNTSTISYETDNLTIKEINKLVSNIEDGVTVTEIINQNKEYKLLPLILGIIFAIVGLYIKMPWYFNDIFIILSYILLLYKTFIKDVHMILKGKLNENLLISVSCIGAYLVGQKMEGAMVITLYVIGKILEEKAVNNTRTSIKDLMNIKQDYANLLTNNNITQKMF